MEKAIQDLEALRGTPLLLFVRYSDRLEKVTSRLARCFNPDDVIMRAEDEPTPSLMMVNLIGSADKASQITPEEMPGLPELPPMRILTEIFADDPPLASLCDLLTNPQEKPAIALAAWASRELEAAATRHL